MVVPSQAKPLADYKMLFDRTDAADRIEINHAGYRLLQSACFRKSEGKLHLHHLPRSSYGRSAAECLRQLSHGGTQERHSRGGAILRVLPHGEAGAF